MKILVNFEESATVRDALRSLGHDAWSCDLLPTRGDPRWHIQSDGIEVVEREHWDMMIAFPPCTHLAVSGARHFAVKKADGRQQQGIDLFMAAVKCMEKIGRGAIENPVGIMSTLYRKPDQIIQPYQFGDEATKTTCIWVLNLPILVPTNIVGKGARRVYPSGKSHPEWFAGIPTSGNNKKNQAIRSKTFQGIANAMAAQWGTPESQDA